ALRRPVPCWLGCGKSPAVARNGAVQLPHGHSRAAAPSLMPNTTRRVRPAHPGTRPTRRRTPRCNGWQHEPTRDPVFREARHCNVILRKRFPVLRQVPMLRIAIQLDFAGGYGRGVLRGVMRYANLRTNWEFVMPPMYSLASRKLVDPRAADGVIAMLHAARSA